MRKWTYISSPDCYILHKLDTQDFPGKSTSVRLLLISSHRHLLNNLICNTSQLHTGAPQLNILCWNFFFSLVGVTASRPNHDPAVLLVITGSSAPVLWDMKIPTTYSSSDTHWPGPERKVSAEPRQSAAVCQRTHSSVRCSGETSCTTRRLEPSPSYSFTHCSLYVITY